MTRKPNLEEKRARLGEDLARFVQDYARKAPGNGRDPNDRTYDKKVERTLRSMRPEEFDRLLRDE